MQHHRRRTLSRVPRLSADEWRTIVESLELTPQESNVLRCLMHARRDKQIAAELGVSVFTVRTYFRNLFARHRVADRLELALLVMAVVRRELNDADPAPFHEHAAPRPVVATR